MIGDYFLGVDGGNTKTEALLATRTGKIVGRGMAGCSDIYGAPSPAAALAQVDSAISQCCDQASIERDAIGSAVFSMAGADWPEDFTFLEDAIRSRGITGRVTVYNDALGALRAGSSDFTGVSVVCGTGAATGARSASGKVWHSSWWQDVQGGHELGRKALWAVFRAAVGIAPPTSMTESLLEIYEVQSVESLLHLATRRERNSPFSAQPAGRVLTAQADAGDPVALQILTQHGHALGVYAVVAAGKVGIECEPFSLVLAGTVLASSAPLQRAVKEEVLAAAPGAHAALARHSPAAGALLLSFDQAGVTFEGPPDTWDV